MEAAPVEVERQVAVGRSMVHMKRQGAENEAATDSWRKRRGWQQPPRLVGTPIGSRVARFNVEGRYKRLNFSS